MAAARVSVVMPTYNQERYVERAVQSILAQDLGEFEFVIIDDGSTDGTGAYLDGIEDPRVRVIHQENRGVPATLNRAFAEYAHGDLLTWVSSDNIHPPWFLSAFVGALAKYPEAGFAYSPFYTIDAEDRVTELVAHNDLQYRRLLLATIVGGCAGFMYRREILERVGGYSVDKPYTVDTDMWLRIFEHTQAVYVLEPTCYFRVHAEQTTLAKADAMREGLEKQLHENLQGLQSHGIDLAKLYGVQPGDAEGAFAALTHFAARLRQRVGEPAVALSVYDAALTNAPRPHVVDTVAAMAQCAGGLSGQALAQRVADGLSRGGRLSGPDILDMASLAALLADLQRRIGGPAAGRPLVCLDAPAIDQETARRRLVYSHFGERARPSGGSA
ncbi:MAG: glycosyltransferase family 2 protein [Actinomycetota bacterium]